MKIKVYNETSKEHGYWVDTVYDQSLQESYAIIISSNGNVYETYLRNITVVGEEYLVKE